MRLRYLRLHDEPPLQNVVIPFGHEQVLGRNCAIRFVVGVNGSGKSRLMRALTQTFLFLEQGRLPPFPITLVYDLGDGDNAQTILLRHQGQPDEALWRAYSQVPLPESALLTSDEAWLNHLTGYSHIESLSYVGDFSGSSRELLPKVILAYASGLSTEWERLFTPQHDPVPVDDESVIEERPPGWGMNQEIRYLLQESNQEDAERLAENQRKFDPAALAERESRSSIGYFVTSPMLRLAACAVTLHQALADFRATPTEVDERLFRQRVAAAQTSQQPQTGLRGLLDEVGWLWPISISLKFNTAVADPVQMARVDAGNLQAEHWTAIPGKLGGKEGIATTWRREPEPGQNETFFFDLRAPLPNREAQDTSTLAALLDFLGNKGKESKVTAFDIFDKLYRWQQAGFLQEISIALQKEGVEDLILYDWLSDGEQLFLGRMALFHLLQGVDDALMLLDEPETHFNDVWKRRIVDIIDDSLRDRHSEVVISTHSSIALTDVFDTEITLLKNGRASRPVIRTFGASPSDIMRDVFDAPESVGQRATEFLDLVLMVAAYPDEVQSVWSFSTNGQNEQVTDTPAFQQLLTAVAELPHNYGDTNERSNYVLNVLRSVQDYTRTTTQKDEITVVDAIDALQDRLGPGYYQFEFRRRRRALRERETSDREG